MRILLIDNYDSFTHNLARYIKIASKAPLSIIKNDELSLEQIIQLNPSILVLSPGPGAPSDSGISLKCLDYFAHKIPILGICLGHQCIGTYFGGKISNAETILHGKISMISHTKDPLFQDIPSPFEATRYHSLVILNNTLPSFIDIIAQSDNEIMAIKHKTLPIYGLQFHPEAYLTLHGQQLINNFFNNLKEKKQ